MGLGRVVRVAETSCCILSRHISLKTTVPILAKLDAHLFALATDKNHIAIKWAMTRTENITGNISSPLLTQLPSYLLLLDPYAQSSTFLQNPWKQQNANTYSNLVLSSPGGL